MNDVFKRQPTSCQLFLENENDRQFSAILSRDSLPPRSSLQILFDAANFLISQPNREPNFEVKKSLKERKKGAKGGGRRHMITCPIQNQLKEREGESERNPTIPKVNHIMQIRRFLEGVDLSDVELSEDLIASHLRVAAKQTSRPRTVIFCPIAETPSVTLLLIILSPTAGLKLHNHPAMVVLTKVLMGSVRLRMTSPLSDIERCFNEPSYNSNRFSLNTNPGPSVRERLNGALGDALTDHDILITSYVRSDDYIHGFGCLPRSVHKPRRRVNNTKIPDVPFHSSCCIRSDHADCSDSSNSMEDVTSKVEREEIEEEDSDFFEEEEVVVEELEKRVKNAGDTDKIPVVDLFDGILGNSNANSNSRVKLNRHTALAYGQRDQPSEERLEEDLDPELEHRQTQFWDTVPNKQQGWNSTVAALPVLGNIHSFQAIGQPLAFLDVITPSYCPQAGRNCDFFQPINEERGIADVNKSAYNGVNNAEELYKNDQLCEGRKDDFSQNHHMYNSGSLTHNRFRTEKVKWLGCSQRGMSTQFEKTIKLNIEIDVRPIRRVMLNKVTNQYILER